LVYEKFNFKLVPYLGAAPGERGRGGGGAPILIEQKCLSEIWKRTSMKYQDPVLWAS